MLLKEHKHVTSLPDLGFGVADWPIDAECSVQRVNVIASSASH
jgi:hypothetical protein